MPRLRRLTHTICAFHLGFGLGRHPEDALGDLFVRILLVGALVALGLQLGVYFLEGVGDELEEDGAENDVLVLSSVHTASEGIGHPPEVGAVIRFGVTGSGGGLSFPGSSGSSGSSHCGLP